MDPVNKSRKGKLVLFLLLFLFFYFLAIRFLPSPFVSGLAHLTGYLVVILSRISGTDASIDDIIVTVSGFRMEINDECTGIYYLIIYAGAIIFYPSRTIRYKALGLIAGTCLLVLINAFRIVVLGFIGSHFRGLFDFTHSYLWEGSFTLLVIVIWMAWERGYVITMPMFKMFIKACLQPGSRSLFYTCQ